MSSQSLSQPHLPSQILKNTTILLKNQCLHPQITKISLHQPVVIKVSHNNSYELSEVGKLKKQFIFAIQDLQIQTDPLAQGCQYTLDEKVFTKLGQFRLVCVNLPKVQAKIIVEKSASSQPSDDELLSNLSLNQQDLFIKTPIKLPQVKQQQPQEETLKQPKQQQACISNSKSDIEQYQRMLTEDDDKQSDTLENKYLKYFKEEFKLWRNFFEQQEQKEKKESLKSKHTKNLSLSEVKEVDPKHKSEYDSDHDSSQNNSSSIGKDVSIASHLYSHQQILDRNNDQDINSGRKQMKKTNSQYGFNIMRSQQEKQPRLDKISVFGKEQEQINLPDNKIHHSRRSNKQTSQKMNQKKKSRISMSRTQTNSPALKQYKKQNNFMTWAIEWAKEKQYKQIIVDKKNDHHLIKQLDTFLKNKFKVDEFLYC